MLKLPLNDVKDRVKNGAARLSSKILWRIDIASEESKQEKRFKELGERVFQTLLEGKPEDLKTDPITVELLGSIQEHKKKIQAMQNKLRLSEANGEKN